MVGAVLPQNLGVLFRAGGAKTSFHDAVASTSADTAIKTGALKPCLAEAKPRTPASGRRRRSSSQTLRNSPLWGLCLKTPGKEEAKVSKGTSMAAGNPWRNP